MIATIYTDHIIFQSDGTSTFIRGVDIYQVTANPTQIPGTKLYNYQTTIKLKGGTEFTFRNGQVSNQDKWTNDLNGVAFIVNDIMSVATECCGSGSGGVGIIELTGDVLAGPGYGSVVATIANGVVTVAMMDSEASTAGYVATSDGAGGVTWSPVSGGDVVGPGSSTVGNFPLFNNTTGDLLSDSGLSPSTIVIEDPGPGTGLIEAAPGGGPISLKNVRDGLGTQVQANTGSFQTNVHFSTSDVAFVSDALGDPTEVPVTETPTASSIVKSEAGGKIDNDWVPDFIGDSGSGGASGGVPAPAAGDAAAGKYLDADGTWTTPPAGTGTVTSVAVSGGTTGLTTSGGPVTTSGTITIAGTLALANGGTGATTDSGARTNLGLGTAAVANTGTGASDVPTITQADARYVPITKTINAQTGTTYTLAQADYNVATAANTFSNAAAITLTLPLNATVPIAVGSVFDCFQIAAGQVTVSPAGGVTLSGYGSWFKTAGQGAAFSVVKTATDTWRILGNMVP